MVKPPVAGEIALLLDLLDEAYDRSAWHGPNLRGSLRGLTAGEAAWRPAAERNAIWQVVLHCAYWKYAVRRRITGALKRGSFARAGSNWFPLPSPANAAAWRSDLALLDAEHAALRAVVETLRPAELVELRGGSTVRRLAMGIAAHDLYHAGQVRLLIRLAGAKARRRKA
jgi:uncharacterized damage-inducible protein DinB